MQPTPRNSRGTARRPPTVTYKLADNLSHEVFQFNITTGDDSSQIFNGKMPLSAHLPHDTKDSKDSNSDTNPSPPPYSESATPSRPPGPTRLHILGATWGGITVTPEIRAIITLDKTSHYERLKLNMHTLHTLLLPDPAPATIKALVILYHYDDNNNNNNTTLHLLNATQFAPQIHVKITPTAHLDQNKGILCAAFPKFITTLGPGTGWDNLASGGQTQIVAVVYGTGRITATAVMEELGGFFEGRRGQVRTTTGFFGGDTWPGVRKSWTVFFRLGGGEGEVQCITGMEDGALEVPWRWP